MVRSKEIGEDYSASSVRSSLSCLFSLIPAKQRLFRCFPCIASTGRATSLPFRTGRCLRSSDDCLVALSAGFVAIVGRTISFDSGR